MNYHNVGDLLNIGPQIISAKGSYYRKSPGSMGKDGRILFHFEVFLIFGTIDGHHRLLRFHVAGSHYLDLIIDILNDSTIALLNLKHENEPIRKISEFKLAKMANIPFEMEEK